MHTLRSLRVVFGDELRPSADLLAWAKTEAIRERSLRTLAKRDDTDLRLVGKVAPTLALAMANRTYQRVGAAFGAKAGSFLLADEPGLGKTATTFASVIEMDAWRGDHLVVAPKASLNSVWGRQARMWVPDAEVVVMPEGKANREAALRDFFERDSPRFLVLNLAMIRRKYNRWCRFCEVWEDAPKEDIPMEHWTLDHKFQRAVQSEDWPEILDNGWTSVTLDESHQALTSWTGNKTKATQQVSGLLDLAAEHKIALTGTPLRGSERNIWGTLDWLGHKTGGYWGWVNDFFEVSSNGFGKVVHGLDPEMAEEFYRSLDRFVLRRTRAEVRPDLPIGQRIPVYVDMTKKQRQQYTEFQLMGETALSSGMVSGQGVLSELTRLKQMAFGVWHDPKGKGHLEATGESEKIDWILQFLLERGVTGNPKTDFLPEKGSGYKYVIGSHMTEIVDAVERSLVAAKIKTMKITGAVTGDKRTSAIDKFQSDDEEFRVMIINTQTGGASIELDAWCDEMIILDETWISDDQVQLEGRINNRSGRIAPRTWWYLRMADTIEESIAAENHRQQDLQHKLLDGRRGVTTALHLIRNENKDVSA